MVKREKMEIIKIVPECRGGSGGLYGRISFPKKYIGNIMFMRLASDNEIKRFGIDEGGRGRFDEEGYKRMKQRKEKLNNHIIKLRELRTIGKYALPNNAGK